MGNYYLIHEGVSARDGAPGRGSGRYPLGSGKRPFQNGGIGVRAYQNKDGTLTLKGKKRYERDVRENLAKKKENRIDTSKPDPQRWVREDLGRAKDAADSASKMVTSAKKVEEMTRKPNAQTRMDLSHMTDKELRDRIERENLERRYNDLFNDKAAISSGRQKVINALNMGELILGVGTTALGLAVAINQLKQG